MRVISEVVIRMHPLNANLFMSKQTMSVEQVAAERRFVRSTKNFRVLSSDCEVHGGKSEAVAGEGTSIKELFERSQRMAPTKEGVYEEPDVNEEELLDSIDREKFLDLAQVDQRQLIISFNADLDQKLMDYRAKAAAATEELNKAKPVVKEEEPEKPKGVSESSRFEKSKVLPSKSKSSDVDE